MRGLLALPSEGDPDPTPAVYLIAGRGDRSPAEHLARVRASLEAGVAAVQMREKGATREELRDLGRALRTLCADHGAPFVVNDDPGLARELGADGLHLGQEDLAPAAARAIVGAGMRIGLSTHDRDQARRALGDPAVDHIGVGPVWATRTKDAGAPLGPDEAREIATLYGGEAWPIGGIDARGALELAARGLPRAAVSLAILGADDVGEATRAILIALGAR
ncbi:MAG: thiamine phosphate synthase [Planctomycetota bacterium]